MPIWVVNYRRCKINKKIVVVGALAVIGCTLAFIGYIVFRLISTQAADGDPVRFDQLIDQRIEPVQTEVIGLDGGTARAVGAAVDLNGVQTDFVLDEVLFFPESQDDLAAFLESYNGTILRDGSPPTIPGGEAPAVPVESSGWYLIRVDLTRSSIEDLEANLEADGAASKLAFSSEEAASLAALLLRESSNRRVGPNVVFYLQEIGEHPDGSGGNLDAESWWWMSEDDDPNTPGDQGLSIGVVHAWQYLSYMNFPPRLGGVWRPPVVAIIDSGFNLDLSTGAPLGGNLDYNNSINAPQQYDLVDYDNSAGGAGVGNSCGGSPCPWHGQGAFGVAAAYPRNGYGSAGTGGNVVRPMLLKIDLTFANVAGAIRAAAIHGADVINLSLSAECNRVCRFGQGLLDQSLDDAMQDAVRFADGWGAIVVAGAGNYGRSLDTNYQVAGTNTYIPYEVIPCELSKVVCVGAIDIDGNAASYSNYGNGVDIWAPGGDDPNWILSTVIPTSAGMDADDVGVDELYIFGGTSAAAPHISGIIALMRALNPSLRGDDITAILQATANSSTDPKVGVVGYVDAYRAVMQVRANQPHSVRINLINDGDVFSYLQRPTLGVQVDDPEAGNEFLSLGGIVEILSNLDGRLCLMESGSPTGYVCALPQQISQGFHTITAIATDPFGATASHAITIEIVNRPPEARINSPAGGATFYADQTISFNGSGHEFDEVTTNIPLEWHSSLDGALGNGPNITASLSTGSHVITLTATDELGLTGQDTISLTVLPGEGIPSAIMLSPVDLATFGVDDIISFQGQGSDPEDGALAGSSLEWTSDIDGFLGTGNNFTRTLTGDSCSPVLHTITLLARDSDGREATTQINIYVGRVC